MAYDPEQLLNDWFGEARRDAAKIPAQVPVWFQSTKAGDEAWRKHYADWLAAADNGALNHWQNEPASRLALIVLLDQLPRNLFRGAPGAFERDPRACALSLAGIATRMDRDLSLAERAFFYMPLEHAEDPAAQRLSVETFERLAEDFPENGKATATFVKFAREHAAIVERFGRFPHRNAILGRPSTAEETAWLDDGAPTYGQG